MSPAVEGLEGAAPRHPVEDRARRLVEITLFVAVWVGIGELLDMNPNIYLVFGVPLTIAFQLYVARRPLHEMWVRHAAAFHPSQRDLMVAGLLAIVPVITFVSDVSNSAGVPFYLWDLTAIAATVPCAWALRQFVPRTRRYLLFCLATAGVIGVFWMVGLEFLDDRSSTAPPTSRASTSSSSSSTCCSTCRRCSCSRRSPSAACSTPTSSTRASTTGC